MKAIMALSLTIIFAALTPASALAWFNAQPQVSVQPNVVRAAVYNPYPVAIFCQGYVQGITQNGIPVNNGFSGYVPPGMTAYTYVYATAPYFFVNGQASINCQ